MSSETSISLKDISKAYEIYAQPADRLKQMLLGKRCKLYKEFWAVRNLDLEIKQGETVGIVGRNGSGKSTLLQIICGTLQPTSGEVNVRGRISALLELGAGFNKEFTGKENVYLKAALMGLSDREIGESYDSILSFADIGEFIDQPVKTYSSGMYTRLAFAVAINVDPDILVIDEALSVGDEAFKRKCFSRLMEIRERGCTILFVSHAASNIVELCSKAVLMDRGERLLTGEPKLVISKYQKLLYASPKSIESVKKEIVNLDTNTDVPSEVDSSKKPVSTKHSSGAPSINAESLQSSISFSTDEGKSNLNDSEREKNFLKDGFDPNLKPESIIRYMSQGARIQNVNITTEDDRMVNILHSGRNYLFQYEVKVEKPVFSVRCGMMIKTISGVNLGGMVSHAFGDGIESLEAGTLIKVKFPFKALLGPGTYFANAGVKGWIDDGEGYLHRIMDATMFRIEPIKQRTTSGYVVFSDNSNQVVLEVSSQNNKVLS